MTALHPFPGMQFRPWGTDAVGTVVAVTQSGLVVTYDHEPEKKWPLSKAEFTDRFAEPVGKGQL